ncbi:hypothetical protein P1312_050 [Thermobifida phage P1312]|nr:hypothetical protein P1312_050 [Thermobifida phage P1312]
MGGAAAGAAPFYSTSGPRLGGLFPAGATALTACDRRGDIVHGDFPISAARAAGRGVVLDIRLVGGLQPLQGRKCGPGLRPELGGDELHLFQCGELPHPIPERVHAASANLGGDLQQLQPGAAVLVFGDRGFRDPDDRVSGRGTRGRRRHSRESAGPHGAAVDPLHVSGDDQVRPVGALRHGARDDVNRVRLRGRENTVGVSQLLHDQGDSVDIPGRGGRGGDARRGLFRLDHDLVTVRSDERDGVRREVNKSHGVLSCCVVGVLGVVDQVVRLVEFLGELGGKDVVQFAAVGVVQQGGGVGEDRRAAGLGGGLGEDFDLAVDIDGEDGQVGELGFGELTDVRGGDEVHDPVPSGRALGLFPGAGVWGRSPDLVTPSLASGSGSVKWGLENFLPTLHRCPPVRLQTRSTTANPDRTGPSTHAALW